MKAKKSDQLYEYPADFFLLLESFNWDRWRFQIRELLELCDTETNHFEKYGPPLIDFFEIYSKKKLIAAGFDKEEVENPQKLKSLAEGLNRDALRYYGRPPQSFPDGTFETSKDKTRCWVNQDIEAAIRALESIGSLKDLLKDKRDFKVLLLTVDMLTNFMRSGSLADLAKQGANQSDSQTERRAKRATWAGMTKAEIQTRNEKINADFAASKLTRHGFAVRHAKLKTYKSGNGGHLSWRGILKVLNSLP